MPYSDFRSLQNKIWNLPDQSTILPKFIYGKEGKLAGPTQVLAVRVRGPALILKTVFPEKCPSIFKASTYVLKNSYIT